MEPDQLDRLERCELLEGIAVPDGYSIQRSDDWIYLNRPDGGAAGLFQGWKLHVSARPASLRATIEAVAPVLFAEGCDFKIVASMPVLQVFNDGVRGIGAVGKSITVYPDQHRIVEIAHHLASVLSGFDAPRIQSDRQVRFDAPVYYRYGPFLPRLRFDENGVADVTLQGPDGRIASGLAGDTYAAPDWIEDPFGSGESEGTTLPRSDGAIILGDHYRITSVIIRTYRGAAYRAVDMRTDKRVVIKHAIAFVNESALGDARTYLRNELRILKTLEGIDGLPALVDYFSYGPDEYIVISELGPSNLRNDVVDEGVFSCQPSAPRSLLDLAKGLLRMLDEIHQRGVVVRDLAPKNVVPIADGKWGLVDFELSRFDRTQLFGWTPGYSVKEQRTNQPASVADDYFSLGATLIYALTGLDPIIIDEDPDVNTARTLDCLSAICGRDAPIFRIVSGLLDGLGSTRAAAAAELRATSSLETLSPARSHAAHPPVETILRNTLGAVVRMTEAGLQASGTIMPPSVVAQVGMAGAVAELALHAQCVGNASSLAWLTARTAEAVDTPAGLMYGRMGVALAVQAAARASNDPRLAQAAERLLPGAAELANAERVDVSHGLAGLGIGYLAFADRAPDGNPALSLANVCAHRLLDNEAVIEDQLARLPNSSPAHAISIADGFVHGRAGIAYFLLAHAVRSGDEMSLRRARAMLDALAAVADDLATRAVSERARPMSASWCQGLAGIGAALSRAAHFFGDERYLAAARRAADGCLAIAPRVPLVTQCCGLAGTGELLLDLGLVTQDARYNEEARGILGLMLMRSGGSSTAPRFPSSQLGADAPCWGTGTTGILSFLRRLIDPASPRLWLSDNERMMPS